MPPRHDIEDLLQQARTKLTDNTESARLEAEILLAFTLGKNRSWLRTWPEHIPSPDQQDTFDHLLMRRTAGEPIAYITGERDFWDMTLRVTPDTLIPRPETERLVELALEHIPQATDWRIADLGTGSGAIALALARERPRCHLIATDVSAAALQVARSNAKKLGIRNIEFRLGPWLAPLAGERLALIASNPPYIHPDDPHLCCGDLRFEPAAALGSAPDGLHDIREITREARGHLLSGGWLLLEHGYDQGSAVRAILAAQGYCEVATHSDLGGHDRTSQGRTAPHTSSADTSGCAMITSEPP